MRDTTPISQTQDGMEHSLSPLGQPNSPPFALKFLQHYENNHGLWYKKLESICQSSRNGVLEAAPFKAELTGAKEKSNYITTWVEKPA